MKSSRLYPGKAEEKLVPSRSAVPRQRAVGVAAQTMNQGPQVRQLMHLARLANQGPRVTQRHAALDAVLQAKTKVKWTAQDFPYVTTSKALATAQVGSEMDAQLDHTEPIQGNDAESSHQAELYDSLKTYWNPGSKKWIRGHLLNANLGGPNVAVNLFPITGHANGDHLHYVENHVKKWILEGRDVNYRVKAVRSATATGRKAGSVDVPNAAGVFECFAETTNAGTKKQISRNIESLPVPAGTSTGHASTAKKFAHVDSEEALALFDKEMFEVMDKVSVAEDMESEFDKLTEGWGKARAMLLRDAIFAVDETEEDSELEDTENDKAGRVLNAGLKKWINHKKLGKSDAARWLTEKKKSGESAWEVSS